VHKMGQPGSIEPIRDSDDPDELVRERGVQTSQRVSRLETAGPMLDRFASCEDLSPHMILQEYDQILCPLKVIVAACSRAMPCQAHMSFAILPCARPL
jgi:hypothetical protein